MKTCAYCGRASSQEATHCHECGTELAEPAEAKPSPPRDWAWLRYALAYTGVLFLVGLLYLLSAGPVSRYTGTVIFQGTNTPAAGVAVTRRVVRYPSAVMVFYYPAFSLAHGPRRGSLAELYRRYVEWWEEPSARK
ncbi:MAG: hypothetical protein ABSF95_15270 [Verrucomicrobiota bacterium]|jgi:hypothetical protein